MKTYVWVCLCTPCYKTAERCWVINPDSKFSFTLPFYKPNKIMFAIEKFIDKYNFVHIGY